MSKCIVCGGEIKGRAGKRTCSNKCRMILVRHPLSVTDKPASVTDVKCNKDSVTVKPLSVTGHEPYVIPMTRKVAIEICKADAHRGDVAPLTGELKRKVFSALHNVHDCRHVEL